MGFPERQRVFGSNWMLKAPNQRNHPKRRKERCPPYDLFWCTSRTCPCRWSTCTCILIHLLQKKAIDQWTCSIICWPSRSASGPWFLISSSWSSQAAAKVSRQSTLSNCGNMEIWSLVQHCPTNVFLGANDVSSSIMTVTSCHFWSMSMSVNHVTAL